jgi:hypothetical protein
VLEDQEYILPIRVDDVELEGMAPTTGYLRYSRPSDVTKIAAAFAAKFSPLVRPARFAISAKWLENIKRISELWVIDCIAFAIDRRFVLSKDGLEEYRIGASFGINTTVPRRGFLAPAEQNGINVIGIHNVNVSVGTDKELRLIDMWIDSVRAGPANTIAEAIAQARAALDSMTDEEYARSLKLFVDATDVLRESKFTDLDHFEIVR